MKYKFNINNREARSNCYYC